MMELTPEELTTLRFMLEQLWKNGDYDAFRRYNREPSGLIKAEYELLKKILEK